MPFLVKPRASHAFLKYAMTDITDDELNATVREVLSQFPNSGIRIMKGHLLSQHSGIWMETTGLLDRGLLSTEV